MWSFDLNSKNPEWFCNLTPSDRVHSWFDGKEEEDDYFSEDDDKPDIQPKTAPIN